MLYNFVTFIIVGTSLGLANTTSAIVMGISTMSVNETIRKKRINI